LTRPTTSKDSSITQYTIIKGKCKETTQRSVHIKYICKKVATGLLPILNAANKLWFKKYIDIAPQISYYFE